MKKFPRPIKSKAIKIITAFIVSCLVCIFISFAVPIAAQEAPVEDAAVETVVTEAAPEEAITTEDPKISLKKLTLLLKPLTLGQLENEAAAWQEILQDKVQQISDAEIALESQGGADAQSTQASELKAEEVAIVARFNLVLDELEAKGGDISSYRQYIDAVSGLAKYVTNSGGLGTQLVSWFTSEEGGIKLAIDVGIALAKILAILLIALIAAPRIGKLADTLLSKVSGISVLFRQFIVNILKRAVWVIGVLIALAALGVDLGPILAVVGGASFVLAFALQSNLGNFASGLMLLINKPFDVGDEVKVAGYWAYIDSISLASTKLKDFGGNIVTLPNNTVWGGDIINYTHSDLRKLSLPIHVRFTQDLDAVYEMWKEIASAHPKVLDDPGPGFFPWNSSYQTDIWVNLIAWSKTEDYWSAYLDLLKILQKRVKEAGIDMAYPRQEIFFNQGIPEAIVKQLEQDDNLEKPIMPV